MSPRMRSASECWKEIFVDTEHGINTAVRKIRAALGEDAERPRFLHTVRANTHDQSPPPAAYIPTSGGLLRDCSIHDFDIIRFVTGREVTSVFATGANKGASFFTEVRLVGVVGTLPALLVIGYTGVLLAATAVPLWTRSYLLLGPLFLASALSSATAAIALVLAAARGTSRETLARLERLDAAIIIE